LPLSKKADRTTEAGQAYVGKVCGHHHADKRILTGDLALGLILLRFS
jgi:hypothetical protein